MFCFCSLCLSNIKSEMTSQRRPIVSFESVNAQRPVCSPVLFPARLIADVWSVMNEWIRITVWQRWLLPCQRSLPLLLPRYHPTPTAQLTRPLSAPSGTRGSVYALHTSVYNNISPSWWCWCCFSGSWFSIRSLWILRRNKNTFHLRRNNAFVGFRDVYTQI